MEQKRKISYDYLLKYIIVGDMAVGKSNILIRYIHGEFNKEYQATIGVEFGVKNINIRNKTYRIQIWDTAGQENFKSITKSYYKNSACSIIVYDITSRDSFNHVKSWIEDCKNTCPKTVFMVLVGNKIDLVDKRVVTKEEGEEFAEENNLLFFETSALKGENIIELFENTADEIAKKIDKGYYDLDDENCGILEGKKEKNEKNVEIKKEDKPKKKNKKFC